MEPEKATTLAARASSQQRMKYRITPQADVLMSAKGLGGQLTALAELFAKSDDGIRMHALVAGIATEPDGSICFELLLCPSAEDLCESERKLGRVGDMSERTT